MKNTFQSDPPRGGDQQIGPPPEDGTPGPDDSVKEEASPPIVDVWSRTRRKYRLRAVLLLLINAILFGGLCCFSHWLRTGRALAFIHGDYWDDLWRYFRPTGDVQVTLSDLLVRPISYEEVPFQIIILGVLMASLVSIPILVAILYRFPFSLIFIGLIGFVAMIPWLAITLLIACMLATAKRLKMPFRYASALLALIPVAIYFMAATREPGSSLAVTTSPADYVKLYAPWLIAIVASCLIMAIVLLCAWIVNYRPGAIAPLLAILFAIPILLFEAKVGRDELYYRLLEQEYGPASPYFADIDANYVLRQIAEAQMRRDPRPGRDFDAVLENVKRLWSFQFYRHGSDFQSLFAQHRDEAVEAYNEFLQAYPNSRHTPSVLYLKGRALDMRIDRQAFRRHAVIHYYSDFPCAPPAGRLPAGLSPPVEISSKNTWATLADQYPEALPTAVAHIRLAQLAARNKKIDEAIEHLDLSIFRLRLEGKSPPAPERRALAALFASKPPTSTLDLDPEAFLLESRKLRNLFATYRDAPHGDLPLAEYMKLDPHHPRLAENLEQLLRNYPRAKITDYVKVQLANLDRSRYRRISSLRSLVKDKPDGKATDQAMFLLGAALQEDYQFEEARKIFEQLRTRHPDSVWTIEADKKLESLRHMQPPIRTRSEP